MHDPEATTPHGMVIKIIGRRTMDWYASSLEEKLEWGAVVKSQIQHIDCEFEKILFWNNGENYVKDKVTSEVSSEPDLTVEEPKIPEGKQEVESSIEMREISIVYPKDRTLEKEEPAKALKATETKEVQESESDLEEAKLDEPPKKEEPATQEKSEIEVVEAKEPPQEAEETSPINKEHDITVTIQD